MDKEKIKGQSRFRQTIQKERDKFLKDFKHQIDINKVSLSYNLVKSTNCITINQYPKEDKWKLIKFIESQNYSLVDSGPVTGREGKARQRLGFISNTFFSYAGITKIEVFEYLDFIDFDTEVTIKIHYMTEKLYNAFINFLKTVFLPMEVSQVEVTWDFFTEDLETFQRVINQYLFKKYNRSQPNKFKTTYYLQESTKSNLFKTYPKHNLEGLPDVQPFRLEATFKKSKINKLNIEFDNLYEKLSEYDFQDFFEFKRFNKEKYLRIMVERYRREIKKKDHRYPLEHKLDLYRRTLESHLSSINTDDEGTIPVAELYAKLKTLRVSKKTRVRHPKSMSQFFDKYTELNDQFFSVINAGSFLL